MNKREKIAFGLAITGIVWYFAQNFYFGWNMKPESVAEGITDFMVWIFWVLAYFIKPSRVEHKTENHLHNITTDNIEIIKPTNVIYKPIEKKHGKSN